MKAIKKAARVSRGELLHGTFCPWVGGWETEIARCGCPLFEMRSQVTGLNIDWGDRATYNYVLARVVGKLPSMALLS